MTTEQHSDSDGTLPAARYGQKSLEIVLLCGDLVVYSLAWCVANLVLLFPERSGDARKTGQNPTTTL